MQYYQCKCGDLKVWSSGMPIATCSPCRKCKSVPAGHPGAHPEPTPHNFSIVEQVMTDSGLMPLSRCRLCMKTKVQLAKEEALDASH